MWKVVQRTLLISSFLLCQGVKADVPQGQLVTQAATHTKQQSWPVERFKWLRRDKHGAVIATTPKMHTYYFHYRMQSWLSRHLHRHPSK